MTERHQTTHPIIEDAENEIEILPIVAYAKHGGTSILCGIVAFGCLVCEEDPLIATGDRTSTTLFAVQTF